MKLAKRVQNLEESATLKMASKALELKDQGVDVINLSLGEPDFDTPDYIKEAAKKALDRNFTHYSPVPGFKDLRQAIQKKFKVGNGIDYSLEQIVVSNGAKQSIMNVILALTDPGTQVVLPTPYWVSYKDMAKFAGAEVTEIHTDIQTDFKMTPKLLTENLTADSRLLIFSNPCNPSGSVYTKKELASLVDIFKKYPDLIIISDEIYECINYQGEQVSLASFAEIKEQVVTVNGFSKGYAMTGWRLGYLGAPLALAQACAKIQGQFTSGANSIAQKAAVTALNTHTDSSAVMKEKFQERRDYLIGALGEIPGFKVNIPQGAFYLFPDVSELFGTIIQGTKIETATQFSEFLLSTVHVATTPGEPFGNPDNIRLSYAAKLEDLKEAVKRIKSLF